MYRVTNIDKMEEFTWIFGFLYFPKTMGVVAFLAGDSQGISLLPVPLSLKSESLRAVTCISA
jgi:hypothetical protein